MRYDFDLIVIGGGAAGLVASKFAAGMGKKVAIVEKDKIGGECTHYGCVPSKTLIKTARIWHLAHKTKQFGLPELDDVLSLDEPLKQRVAVKFRLKSFMPATTEEYVRHRLNIAGSDKEVFAREALDSIHLFSRGIPRLINTICDNAMLEGFLTKRSMIGRDIIEEVACDFGLNIEEGVF